MAVQADIGCEDQIRRLFAVVDVRFGQLNAFVNNAGIVDSATTVTELTGERMLRFNTIGVFLCAREAVLRMSTTRGAIAAPSSTFPALQKAGRTAPICRIRSLQRCHGRHDTRLGQRGCSRRNPRECSPPRLDRHGHPRQRWAARSHKALGSGRPHATRRNGRGGGQRHSLADVGRIALHHRQPAGNLRRQPLVKWRSPL